MKILARFVAAMLPIFTFAPFALAQMPMGQPMPGYGMPMQPGMQANPMTVLGLTEEQRKKLAAIVQESQAKNMQIMSEVAKEMQAAQKLFLEDKPDTKKISAAYQRVFDKQRKAIELSVEMYNKQIAVFNKEQLEKWNAMRKQMAARMAPAGP